jgi:hypothetical protein
MDDAIALNGMELPPAFLINAVLAAANREVGITGGFFLGTGAFASCDQPVESRSKVKMDMNRERRMKGLLGLGQISRTEARFQCVTGFMGHLSIGVFPQLLACKGGSDRVAKESRVAHLIAPKPSVLSGMSLNRAAAYIGQELKP